MTCYCTLNDTRLTFLRGHLLEHRAHSLNLLINKYHNYPHWHEIDDFLVKISKFRPKVIILFGSLVKGEYTQNSDIDLLIVSSTPVL